jgi:V/A-type H+-transporting ATPase subunit C
MINDYDKVFHHVQGEIKIFLKLLYNKYEIENLKVIFRILESGNNISLSEDSFTFLSKNEDIRVSKLIESKSSASFIANLKGSVYYDVLKDYEQNTTFLNLFNIETSLDQYYFSLLMKKKKKLLTDEDEKVIHEALVKQIDIMNLLWIYRSKKYFDMNREEIYNNMIQNKSKLNRETMKELVDAKDVKAFSALIKNTMYKDDENGSRIPARNGEEGSCDDPEDLYACGAHRDCHHVGGVASPVDPTTKSKKGEEEESESVFVTKNSVTAVRTNGETVPSNKCT